MIDVFPAVNGTVKELPGFFKLPCAFSADLGEFSECSTAAFYERTGSVRGGDACLRLVRDEALAAGAYRLEVSENGITVGASCEAGVIYALTTAAQLSAERAVPCCEILDEPVYSHRGLSLDTVRHFVPVQEIKRIMEQMSLVRMSILHLHLTDDQGWRIELYSRLPQIS